MASKGYCCCCGCCCIIYSVKDQKQGAAEAAKTTTKVSATCCSARLLGGLPLPLPQHVCLHCSELQVQLLPLLLSIFGEGKCCYCVAHTHRHTLLHTHMQLIIAYSASCSSGRLSFCCPSLGTPSSCFLYALSFLRHHRRQCLSVSACVHVCVCVCVIGEWHVATQVGSQLCLGWLPRLNSRFHWPKPEHSISTDHTQSAPKLPPPPPQSTSQPQLMLAVASFMQPASLCLCFALLRLSNGSRVLNYNNNKTHKKRRFEAAPIKINRKRISLMKNFHIYATIK